MVKILVCGDVNGDITALYKRVRSLVKKNPGGFEALFCTGSFFAHDGTGTQLEPFLTGQEKIPLQTYILGPVLPAQTRHFAKCAGGGDLCDSLTFLGQRGVLQLANGLSVAYLSGSLNPRFFNAPPRPGICTHACVMYRPFGDGIAINALPGSWFPWRVWMVSPAIAVGAGAGDFCCASCVTACSQ